MTQKALIAADNPPLANLLKRVLENKGFAVRAASEEPETLRQIRDFVPNLVVVDFFFAKQGITAFIANAIATNPDVSLHWLVLLSGSAEADKLAAIAAWGDKTTPRLWQPFNPTEFVSRVEQALKS